MGISKGDLFFGKGLRPIVFLFLILAVSWIK
jgi:hypothetical protein